MSGVITVPKILFTYWSGDKLSHLHFLTLRAAKHFNPDYKIVVYTAKPEQTSSEISYNSHEHSVKLNSVFPFKALKADVDVIIRELDIFKEYRVKEPLFHTYIADIVRIKKLEEHGGVWFDMDLLFLKPLSKEITHLKQGKSCIATSYSNTIATGLISGLAQCSFFKNLSAKVDEYLEKGTESNFSVERGFKAAYQAFGPDLWRALATPFLDEILDRHPQIQAFKKELVYPYLWNEMDKLFERGGVSKVSQHTLGVHWYNGSSETRKFINELNTFDKHESSPSPMGISVQKISELGVDICLPRISEKSEGLRGANFQCANLQNADLQGVDLRDANLQNANLQNAKLRFADLRGSNLRNANLAGADLLGATFENDIHARVGAQTSDLGISVVMACYNRRSQIEATLNSFALSKHKNLEVIIVDDASSEDQRIEGAIPLGSYEFPIRIITIQPSEKFWKNPGPAYNIGVKYATKQVVVLQNAEVAHVGDVLSYIARNIAPKDWISFNCFGLNEEDSKAIQNYITDPSVAYATIASKSSRIGGNTVLKNDPSGWLNHYEKHFVAYHYCGALFKSDLDRYLAGGFSEEFSTLVGGEDDEFIKRLLFNKFNFKTNVFKEGAPFVLHQHHEKTDAVKEWTDAHYKATMRAFAKSCIRMGLKPENNIELAPKTEIPKARQILVD